MSLHSQKRKTLEQGGTCCQKGVFIAKVVVTRVEDLADELGIGERAIRKRIASLGLDPQRAGQVIVLTEEEADLVRAAKNKPGPDAREK